MRSWGCSALLRGYRFLRRCLMTQLFSSDACALHALLLLVPDSPGAMPGECSGRCLNPCNFPWRKEDYQKKTLLLKWGEGMSSLFLVEGVQKGDALQTLRQNCRHFTSWLRKARGKKAQSYLDELSLSWQQCLFYWPKSWFSHLFSLELWAVIGISFFINTIPK